ncbi:MAG: diacylglycerol kinase family lipid kinase [Eubacteriales bacterium]|nr:diacylglycerol kinase family lipid kinase [Eubacteriales bacterium]
MEKKMLFIFNPKAGKGKIKNHLSNIIDIFNKGGYEVIVRATQGPRDAYEQAVKYAAQVDLIVCCGGDGTLDEVVTGMMHVEDDTPIGYLPAGSTNDFANSLFLPKNLEDAARNVMEEVPYRCDIGRFNDGTFAYVAAFGLFTEVSYATDQDLKNLLGHLAYVIEGIRSLADIRTYHAKVTSEEVKLEGDFIYCMVSNSRSVGGFKGITGKDVDMNDGVFEVTLVQAPKNVLELQGIISTLISGTAHSELVHIFKSSKVIFESEVGIPWTLDGEFGGEETYVEIENRKQALQMYLKSTK